MPEDEQRVRLRRGRLLDHPVWRHERRVDRRRDGADDLRFGQRAEQHGARVARLRDCGGFIPDFRSRLYGVDVTAASDVTALASLTGGGFTPLAKTLLWEGNFGQSNFEGMTFGPTLADGWTSLLLVSDNGGGIRQDLYALAVVPEPSTWVLGALGIACAAWRALRRALPDSRTCATTGPARLAGRPVSSRGQRHMPEWSIQRWPR